MNLPFDELITYSLDQTLIDIPESMGKNIFFHNPHKIAEEINLNLKGFGQIVGPEVTHDNGEFINDKQFEGENRC